MRLQYKSVTPCPPTRSLSRDDWFLYLREFEIQVWDMDKFFHEGLERYTFKLVILGGI